MWRKLQKLLLHRTLMSNEKGCASDSPPQNAPFIIPVCSVSFSSMKAPDTLGVLWVCLITVIPLDFRVVFLLELAFLSLQLQQHQMAFDCLKELSASNITVNRLMLPHKARSPLLPVVFVNTKVLCCVPVGRSAHDDGVCAVWARP